MNSLPSPKISVILPFYQAEKFLCRSVESIINQSFTDWELLLINNNSSDKDRQIALGFCEKDKRIKLLDEPCRGIASALNTGLKYSEAPVIARMDADDISMPERLRKQYDFLQVNPDIGVISCCCQFQSELSESKGYHVFTEWQNSIITSQQHNFAFFAESPIAHPSVMFRRELIDKYGFYSTESIPEDYELWLRWFSEGVHFEKLPETLVVWQDHEQRLSRNHKNYSSEAFDRIKIFYLSHWIKKHVNSDKKIVVCGTGKLPRKRAAMLEDSGVPIFGFTDLKQKSQSVKQFIKTSDVTVSANCFLISFISKRGVGEQVRKFLHLKGFREGNDFVIAS